MNFKKLTAMAVSTFSLSFAISIVDWLIFICFPVRERVTLIPRSKVPEHILKNARRSR